MFFRLIKLLFTGFSLLTSSIFYWELPEFIKDIIPVKQNDEEFMEKFTQVLMISAAMLVIFRNLDIDTATQLLDFGYNGCILCH